MHCKFSNVLTLNWTKSVEEELKPIKQLYFYGSGRTGCTKLLWRTGMFTTVQSVPRSALVRTQIYLYPQTIVRRCEFRGYAIRRHRLSGLQLPVYGCLWGKLYILYRDCVTSSLSFNHNTILVVPLSVSRAGVCYC